MKSNRIEYAEVVLGIVLGIIALDYGLGFVAHSCNLIFPTSQNSPGCQDSSTNLFGIVGIILAALGGLAVIASIAVLNGRRALKQGENSREPSCSDLLVVS